MRGGIVKWIQLKAASAMIHPRSRPGRVPGHKPAMANPARARTMAATEPAARRSQRPLGKVLGRVTKATAFQMETALIRAMMRRESPDQRRGITTPE
jgi:hypothetical protein